MYFCYFEDIVNLKRNNALNTFSKYTEIEDWLREQWAGFFCELLKRTTHSGEIASLSAQVSQLSEINQTLRTYLESLITAVSPDKSKAQEVIKNESTRLEEVQKRLELEHNNFVRFMRENDVPTEDAINMIEDSGNVEELRQKIEKCPRKEIILDILSSLKAAQRDLNLARGVLNKSAFTFGEFQDKISDPNPQRGVGSAAHDPAERRTPVGNKASRRSAAE
jgi:hypothetical protein